MKGLGNEVAKGIFEANYSPEDVSFYKKPCADSSQEEKEAWIVAKYELGKFIAPWSDERTNLVKASEDGNLSTLLHWLCTEHDPDKFIISSSDNQQTALHLAIQAERWQIAAFLLLWSADPKLVDGKGRTLLHYIAGLDQFSLSFLISILRRAPDTMMVIDGEGKDAMEVAVERGHGDFATILRMFQHDHGKQSTNHSATSLSKATSDQRSDDQSTGTTVTDTSEPTARPTPPKKKKKSLRKFLRHYPKLYKRWAHGRAAAAHSGSTSNGSRRRNSIGSGSHHERQRSLTESMASLNPFAHLRSKSLQQEPYSSPDHDSDELPTTPTDSSNNQSEEFLKH